MGIRMSCDSCHGTFMVAEGFRGKRGKCPSCGSIVSVPLVSPEEPAYRLVPDRPETPTAGTPEKQTKPVAENKLVKHKPSATSEAELLRKILAAFEGNVPRMQKALGYRLGIIVATFAMLLLPVVYLLLIGSVGFFVYWHATHHFEFFAATRHVWLLLFGYAGPLIAGVILLFFMIKPLFAPLPRDEARNVLEPHQEPVLYAFVGRIARAVGAPEPQRIAVSCEVNASAGLGRGLGGLFGNQLVLTLGLPLVAGLNSQQLAGVLAHELGHFSQGAGMRCTYVVRSINQWFMRVVYERDAWDEHLVLGCAESGRFAPIFLLALFCVWLTRRVLWVLMIIGHILSCFLTRQMEYDADRYMAQVAGSERFEEIARRLALWDVSSQSVFSVAPRWWIKDRYPDDLPTLIVNHAGKMPKKLHRTIQQALNKSRTGLFDTHPCLKDRMANVGREDTEGIFHFQEPATRLLRDYNKLARQGSFKLHQAMFGRHVKRDQLVSVVDLEDSA